MFPMRMGRNNGYPGQDLLKQLDFYSDKNGTRTLQIVKLCPFPTDLCIDKQVSVDWNDWNAVCFGRKVNESTPSPLPSPPVKSNISSSKRIHRLVPMKKKRITSPTQVMWRKGKASLVHFSFLASTRCVFSALSCSLLLHHAGCTEMRNTDSRWSVFGEAAHLGGGGWLWVGKRLESSRTITACYHGSAAEWVCHLCGACPLVTVPHTRWAVPPSFPIIILRLHRP